MLAIAGGKGGCGKTTTTLGLATDLARRDCPALAVDADLEMPDLHALAGVPGDPTVAAVVDPRRPASNASDSDRSRAPIVAGAPGSGASDDGRTADDAARVRAVARPVPDHPAAAVLPGGPSVDRRTLRRALRRVRRAPGATLVDCPAGAGPAAVDPIAVADRTLVVVDPSPAGLRDAAKTAALARAVDTPVAAAVVAGADRVPDGLSDLLGAPAVAVPTAADPVAAPACRRARERLIDRLWQQII